MNEYSALFPDYASECAYNCTISRTRLSLRPNTRTRLQFTCLKRVAQWSVITI